MNIFYGANTVIKITTCKLEVIDKDTSTMEWTTTPNQNKYEY